MRDGDDDPQVNQWRVEESDFLQMIPGPTDDRPCRGGRLRLLSLELYREGVILTFLAHAYAPHAHRDALDALQQQPDFASYVEKALAQERGKTAHRPRLAQFVPDEWTAISWHIEHAVRDWLVPTPQVADDKGNTYRRRYQSFTGITAYRSTLTLLPGVQPDARMLSIRFGEQTFTVPIPNRA